MKHPASWATGGAMAVEAGRLSKAENSPPTHDLQGLLDLAILHRWPAEALGGLLALHVDQPRRLLLTAGGWHSLDREARERFVEAAAIDLHSDDAGEREAERQRRQWINHCATTRPVRRARA